MSELAAAAKLAHNIQLIRFCQLAGTALALYDHLITFHQEVDLVWSQHWSIAKALFLWNRYFGETVLVADIIVLTISSPSQKFCFHWFRLQGWASAVVIWSMQIIMQLRIYAMYGRSRRVITLLVSCFVIEVGAMSTILGLSFEGFSAIDEPLLGTRTCIPADVPHYFYSFWLPVIAFECLLFILALRVGVKHLFQMHTVNRREGNNLLSVLVRDSIFYFFATLTTYVTTAVVWMVLPSGWLELPEGFSLTATCIMGCRLVLNLRDAYFLPNSEDIVIDSSTPDTVSRLRALPRTISRTGHFHPTRILQFQRSKQAVPVSPVDNAPQEFSFADMSSVGLKNNRVSDHGVEEELK